VKPRYMLDTNMCIYLMKRQPAEVAARFARCFVGEVVLSAVTLAELEYGVSSSGDNESRNREALDLLLEEIPAKPFGTEAARAYGPIQRATREKKRDALDKLIASHAVALDVILVTNNEADFAGYPGLRVENWATESL
jgi:tRNA(fMet)-specific endonuclease VapC